VRKEEGGVRERGGAGVERLGLKREKERERERDVLA
jgi:hypothetical protein